MGEKGPASGTGLIVGVDRPNEERSGVAGDGEGRQGTDWRPVVRADDERAQQGEGGDRAHLPRPVAGPETQTHRMII